MRGAVGQQRVPEDFIKTYPFLFPLPSEQLRIIEILDQADTLRNKRALADERAARILPALFIKMFGAPTSNPMKWETPGLGDKTDIAYGLAEKLSLTDTAETGVPIVRISNVLLNGELDLSRAVSS